MTRGTTTDASASPARPIRLVYCDESGKFQMDPEAVSVLKLIKEPIGVVSVCGCARQGKSYILNQLLGRSSGFQVASTHRPCTKGLWLWSTPIRRTALDGTEYNLLLIDSEGIDAYDQTGTYSTQIFPLAVLLSSMFIYNQMGGIDEAAIDRLSFVAEMTKHIRVRASTTPSELGQFSPTFVWLLRDFYLDLVEDNRKITPRDYLELALRPVQGGGSAKNEIRESIRGLFPDRDCFTLVRPLSNENELQRLEQLSMDQLRPEFKTGLDALTRYVFERTRPKQVGATVMTGPIFAGITQFFLDALNNGAVPTIASAWQSVEETECQRALEYASEIYKSSFDSTKPPAEATIQEAHEEAVQKALVAFNSVAAGAGSVRQRCEKLLHTFFRKELEDYKREAFRICTNAVQKMEKELRTACQAPGAKFDDILKVLEQLLSSYEATSYGPEKWQKLASFLRQSLEGPVVDFVKRNSSSLDDRYSNLPKAFEAAKHESLEWKRKYEVALSKQKAGEDEVASLKARSSAAEARLAAAREQTLSAQEEADEWKRKYDVAVKEAKNKQTQHREYALPAEFEGTLAEKGPRNSIAYYGSGDKDELLEDMGTSESEDHSDNLSDDASQGAMSALYDATKRKPRADIGNTTDQLLLKLKARAEVDFPEAVGFGDEEEEEPDLDLPREERGGGERGRGGRGIGRGRGGRGRGGRGRGRGGTRSGPATGIKDLSRKEKKPLYEFFEKDQHPDKQALLMLADLVGLSKPVVGKWFSDKRGDVKKKEKEKEWMEQEGARLND